MIYTLISTALVLISTFIFQNPLFGGIAVFFYIGSLGYIVGRSLFSDTDAYSSTLFGSLLVSVGVMILGTILFYVGRITPLSLSFITLLVPIITWLIASKVSVNAPKKKKNAVSFPVLLTTIIYAVLAIFLISLLITARSSDAIQTPWEVVSSQFLVLYALATGVLVFSCIYQTYSRIHTVLISLHLLITYSVTNIVYAVLFGFDPFVHQATEKLLLTTGTISPKPFLYIGQYTFVSWFHTVSHITHTIIDAWLVPTLAAFSLPAVLRYSITKAFNVTERFAALATLSLPVFFLPFFFSVPQNLGNLLLLITVFLSLPILFAKKTTLLPIGTLWLLGIATATVHPFSAIPLLVYVFFVTGMHVRNTFPQYRALLNSGMILGGIAALIAIPVALLTIFNAPTDVVAVPLLAGNTPSWIPFYSPFHLVYFFDKNSVWVLFLITLIGFVGLYKSNLLKKASPLLYTMLVVFGIIVSLRFIPLPIIAYETQEFINRFWQIIALLAMPLVFYAFSFVSTYYKKTNSANTIPLLALFLTLFITMGMYLTYPRNDAFTKSRSFATSSYDLSAAAWIENNANGKDSVILSNQAVAAAALHKYGFKKYYAGIFYYPIPTTSPLYQLYLDMVYKAPTYERLQQSFEVTSAEVAYFVINDYWLDYEKRVAEATKLIGEPYHIVNEHGKPKVSIFKIER